MHGDVGWSLRRRRCHGLCCCCLLSQRLQSPSHRQMEEQIVDGDAFFLDGERSGARTGGKGALRNKTRGITQRGGSVAARIGLCLVFNKIYRYYDDI